MRNTPKNMKIFLAVVALAVAAVIGWVFYSRSRYEAIGDQIRGSPIENSGMAAAPDMGFPGNGVSSSLLPSLAPAPAEDSGMLLPTDILKGQSFLDTRQQIGYPESISGSLRNSNQSIRQEPISPRRPVSIFNTSTIVADTGRRGMEFPSAY